MDSLLSFFSDLVLFSAGLVVIVLWIVILFAIGIEAYDMITGKNKTADEEI